MYVYTYSRFFDAASFVSAFPPASVTTGSATVSLTVNFTVAVPPFFAGDPSTVAFSTAGARKSNFSVFPEMSPAVFPLLSVSAIVIGLSVPCGSSPSAAYVYTYFAPDDVAAFVSSRSCPATFTVTTGSFDSSSLAVNVSVAVAPFFRSVGASVTSPASPGAVVSMLSVFTHRPMFALHVHPDGQSAALLHPSCASCGTVKSAAHEKAAAAATMTRASYMKRMEYLPFAFGSQLVLKRGDYINPGSGIPHGKTPACGGAPGSAIVPRMPHHDTAAYALLAAACFGASAPLAKIFLGDGAPLMHAGLLYAGAAAGLGATLALRGKGAAGVMVRRGDRLFLAIATLLGAIVAPALLMFGLARTPAATASLLLNSEIIFTTLIARLFFGERVGARVILGIACIVAGGVLLSLPKPGEAAGVTLGALAIVGACVCWAADTNLMQRVSAGDAVAIGAIRGAAGGVVNLSVAFALGATLPPLASTAGMLSVGFLGYGLALVLFLVSLNRIGTVRTGTFFATAPFIGAAASMLIFREIPAPAFYASAALMAAGVFLTVTERREA